MHHALKGRIAEAVAATLGSCLSDPRQRPTSVIPRVRTSAFPWKGVRDRGEEAHDAAVGVRAANCLACAECRPSTCNAHVHGASVVQSGHADAPPDQWLQANYALASQISSQCVVARLDSISRFIVHTGAP